MRPMRTLVKYTIRSHEDFIPHGPGQRPLILQILLQPTCCTAVSWSVDGILPDAHKALSLHRQRDAACLKVVGRLECIIGRLLMGQPTQQEEWSHE